MPLHASADPALVRFVDDLLAHRVGQICAVSEAWMNGRDTAPGEAALSVPLTQEMVFCRTLVEASPGVFASGCLGETLGVVRIRDEAREPGRPVGVLKDVSRGVRARRYTYVTAHHPGFDLYTATLHLS